MRDKKDCFSQKNGTGKQINSFCGCEGFRRNSKLLARG